VGRNAVVPPKLWTANFERLSKYCPESVKPIISSSLFERVVTIHCLAVLDLGAGVEQFVSSSRTSGQ